MFSSSAKHIAPRASQRQSILYLCANAWRPLIIANVPFNFALRPGPIRLNEKTTETDTLSHPSGHINFFDFKPYERRPSRTVEERKTVEPVEVAEPLIEGLHAPIPNDADELQFDWPSEEIKLACESLFPGPQEWILPALVIIVPEIEDNGDETGERTQDIQQH